MASVKPTIGCALQNTLNSCSSRASKYSRLVIAGMFRPMVALQCEDAPHQCNWAGPDLRAQMPRASLSCGGGDSWSNGQTEGQNTKLKLVKRQMYGRANLDLLRTRLLGAP